VAELGLLAFHHSDSQEQKEELSKDVADLVSKFQEICLSEDLLTDNEQILKQLLEIKPEGVYSYFADLLSTILKVNPGLIQDDSVIGDVESIVVKLSTSPVAFFDQIASTLFTALLQATNEPYHSKLMAAYLELMKGILKERAQSRAENFKS